MFSLEFPINVTQTWLLNFGITTVIDTMFKNILISSFEVLLVLYLPKIKAKWKSRKNKNKVHDAITGFAEDVADAMHNTDCNTI